MAEPSVKGILVGGVVVNLNRFREAGRISADEIEARLGPAAQELLDTKIDAAAWYPIGSYREILDMVWEIDGRKRPDYMREKGIRWAKKIYDTGMYQQLEYADNAPRIRSGEQAVKQGRLIGSLIGTFDRGPERPYVGLRERPRLSAPPSATRRSAQPFLRFPRVVSQA